MANFTWTLSMMDEDGHTSTMRGSMVRADLAAAQAALETIAETVDVLTGAKIVNAGITFELDTSAWTLKASAAANSDVEIGGRMIFRTLGNFLSKLTVPGFLKDAYTVAGGLIDTASADVLAFISAIVTGGGSTSHWEDISTYQEGYEVFNGQR